MNAFFRLHSAGRLALLLCCLALLNACASRSVPVPDRSPALLSEQAAKAWHAYLAASEAENASPFQLSVSLRYGKQDDTRRVTAIIWGNGGLPVRLDVMAGLGPLVARLREDADSFVAYAPREKKALVHRGPGRALLHFGVPLPFGLADFVALAQGRFVEVFGRETTGEPSASAQGFVFNLPGQDGAQQALLTLRADGLPVHWRQPASGWEAVLGYDDATPPQPYRIDVRHPDGNHAVLLIKARRTPDRAYTDRQLELDLPQDTVVEPLRPAAR